MFKTKNFIPRAYQENILNTCRKKNTLVCIPTGLGKTKIAILLAVEQLNRNPDSKVLLLTPTKPLANQICNEFKECTDIEEDKIILLTGATSPKKREAMYENAFVIIATPQTIQEDIENRRMNLELFSLLIVDEAHRSREHFANTKVASEYIKQNKNGKILALTASPGSTKAKIEEICANLYINAVEIRTEKDDDLREFVQQKDVEYINVELPEEIKFVHHLTKELYKEKLKGLENFNVGKPPSHISKVDLLFLQKRLQFGQKSPSAFYGLSLVAQLLKLNFAMEMIETQGISSFYDFIKKLETEETKAAKIITGSNEIKKAKLLSEQLLKKNIDHPKMGKLIEATKEIIKKKENSRIIIFTNYRNTVENILKILNKANIKATKLVGQKEGLTQKEQIKVIENFNSGEFNCLIATSIGEEGLHIGGADVAIFYDNTPSGIRKIQRSGRVGRLKTGRIIFMITKGTRDSAYYWKSQKDEKRMKGILYNMKDKPIKIQKALTEY